MHLLALLSDQLIDSKFHLHYLNIRNLPNAKQFLGDIAILILAQTGRLDRDYIPLSEKIFKKIQFEVD